MNSRFSISSGEKSRVPLGMDGLDIIKTKDKSIKTKVKKKAIEAIKAKEALEAKPINMSCLCSLYGLYSYYSLPQYFSGTNVWSVTGGLT